MEKDISSLFFTIHDNGTLSPITFVSRGGEDKITFVPKYFNFSLVGFTITDKRFLYTNDLQRMQSMLYTLFDKNIDTIEDIFFKEENKDIIKRFEEEGTVMRKHLLTLLVALAIHHNTHAELIIKTLNKNGFDFKTQEDLINYLIDAEI